MVLSFWNRQLTRIDVERLSTNFRRTAKGIRCDNADVTIQPTVVAQENFMAAINYRFPKKNGHQAEKATIVMTAMKAKLFVQEEPRAPLQRPKLFFIK
jgi:hypothetical protein